MPRRRRSAADRRAQDLAVDRARDGDVGQRQRERRHHPQVVLDVDRALARTRASLRRILPRSRRAAELWRAGCDRVQPQHAPRSGKLAQDVMVRGWILVPVLREGNDGRAHVEEPRYRRMHNASNPPRRARDCARSPRVRSCPSCKRPDPGPDLRSSGSRCASGAAIRCRATSPWFDGKRVALVAARGETLGIQVLHRGGGPVTLVAAGRRRSRASTCCASKARAARSTEMYGGGRGPGDYPDELRRRGAADDRSGLLRDPVARTTGDGRARRRRAPHPGVLHDRADRAAGAAARRVGVLRPARARRDRDASRTPPSARASRCSPSTACCSRPTCRRARGPRARTCVPTHVRPRRDPDDRRRAERARVGRASAPDRDVFAIPIDEPRTPEARAKVRRAREAVRDAGRRPASTTRSPTTPRPEYGDLVDLYISPKAAHLTGDAHRAGPTTAAARGRRDGARRRAAGHAHVGLDRVSLSHPGLVRVGRAVLARPPQPQGPAAARARPARRCDVSFDDGDDHGNLDGVLALPAAIRRSASRRCAAAMQDRALLEARRDVPPRRDERARGPADPARARRREGRRGVAAPTRRCGRPRAASCSRSRRARTSSISGTRCGRAACPCRRHTRARPDHSS